MLRDSSLKRMKKLVTKSVNEKLLKLRSINLQDAEWFKLRNKKKWKIATSLGALKIDANLDADCLIMQIQTEIHQTKDEIIQDEEILSSLMIISTTRRPILLTHFMISINEITESRM